MYYHIAGNFWKGGEGASLDILGVSEAGAILMPVNSCSDLSDSTGTSMSSKLSKFVERIV